MKTVLGIVARDFKALLKNPIALLVVGALLVLPGLYAWYCIVANWDPYANTGNVPVAIVNHDKGASSSLTGEVNVGQQVTDKLRDNDSIDWRFYDDEGEALDDTALSICYATIVLPEDLSENIIGIFEGSSKEPSIYYYPNEKTNAVATKVTDSAAQTLIRQVNQQFSSTVNETVLESVQKVSDQLEDRADETHRSAVEEIKNVQAELDKVIAALDDASASIAGWQEAAEGMKVTLGATAEQLPAIRTALSEGDGALSQLREKTSAFESQLSRTLLDSSATISGISARAASTLGQAKADLETVARQLDSLEQTSADNPALHEAVESIAVVVEIADGVVGGANDALADLDGRVQKTAGEVESATKMLSGEVMPQLDEGAYDLTRALSGLSGAVAQFEPQIAQLQTVLSQTEGALGEGTDAIADAKSLLAVVSANLASTIADLGAIGSALEIDELSDLLAMDPDNVGQFISSPVHLVTEKIYPVSNYGTAVAPFYTNLALWIGCFILISLIKLEVDRTGFEESTTTQRYFARWLMLVILSLLQSQVICGVDILLGIDCAHPALFMLAGAICSFTYMNLIYALAITFRNIGKTLCILLLIMQVPGSSGMYPIEMMPGFFQFIHPFLPFTYGINAMREALCGLYGTQLLGDFLVLAALVPLSLVLGVLIRPNVLNLTQMFDQEMSATGFFASEVHGQGVENRRMISMMRTLASHDSYRDEIEERAWRFNRRYPRLRRAGSIALFVIPFAFLLVILPFNVALGVDIDVKLLSLIVILVLLLVVQVALIVLEYAHRRIVEQTRLIGLELLGDDFDYATLMDQAHGAMREADDEVLRATDRAADEMLGAVPPLSDEVLAMIPATAGSGSGAAGSSAATATAPRPHKMHGGVIRDIFVTDLRLGFQSVIGVVVIMLLVITPSLYAWFNIAGSWNPYGNTGNLKVAVANEDEGYKGDLLPLTLNIGDTVVSQLRGNSSFDWMFVGKDQAVSGVESGEYYAAIEIPSDFSRNMMTYLVDDSTYPDVIYYTNEKENPIAPIITQKGADSIQENIRASFAQRVDGVVLGVAYDLLSYVTNPRIGDFVTKMSGHLDDAIHDMGLGSTELKMLSNLSGTTAGVVDSTGIALEGIEAAGDEAKQAAASAKSGAASASAAFSRAAEVVEGMLSERTLDVEGIQSAIDVAIALLEGGSEEVPELIEGVEAQVEALKGQTSDPGQLAQIDSVLATLRTAEERARAVPGDLEGSRGELDALVEDAAAQVESVKAYFNNDLKPSIASLEDSLSTAGASTGSVVSGLEGTVKGLGDSTGGLSSQLSALSEGLQGSGEKLEGAAGRLADAKMRLAEALSSGDVKQIEAVILGSDTEKMASRLSAPIQEVREPMYPVANYGSSMAPFYTVLSLWVGALVMISTMRVHVVEERLEELRRRYVKVRPRHEFFGRFGIFSFISFLQSALVLLGDLLFLHIQCVNPVLFLLFGLFIGQVFCLIVYTLTELFGDVGKALCVILLIMQVAASGGTFPVEMLDPLLKDLVPFLPFYHAMSLLQECVAGVDPLTCVIYIGALLVIVGIMLLIGVVVRRPFRKLNDFFEEQLEKTGYM